MVLPVQWRLLGPVDVLVDRSPLPIRRPQELATAAFLLLHANRVVSPERLIEALWDAAPPPSARTAVQTYISRLRRALRATGAPDCLLSQPGGYRLVAGAAELDLASFTAATAEARMLRPVDPARAADRLRQGLALWRGAPLGGAVAPFVASAASRLTDQRLTAYEDLADLEFRLGRFDAVVADLDALHTAHPLRERLAARLITVLAGRGEQAQALRVYAAVRCRLVEELGVEPGPELRAAHLRVLRGEPPVAADPPAQAGTADLPAPRRPTPRGPAQLPPDVAAFTGRAAHLRQLDLLLPDDRAVAPSAVVVTAIDGSAGIGKTTLAVHWAHRVADRFPDGQLYVNLRGFAPGGTPVPPADALRGFLAALGVPPGRVPAELDDLSALYRSTLAGRRVLVVLDNARDAGQVRPLLPGTPGCQVVVTSRNGLASLVAREGAHLLTLDVLTDAEARQLLSHRLTAARVAEDPDAVDAIIAACARLPLALAIVAAHAAARPRFPLSTLAADLVDTRTGLDSFDGGDPVSDVRAVFSWSYATLPPAPARLFRLLGLHPGGEITIPAAGSLAGVPPAEARRLLATLVGAHLLTEVAPGRYTCHDLLRAYAAERAHEVDDDADRRAAVRRLVDHHVHAAHAAAGALNPLREAPRVPLCPAAAGVAPLRVTGHDAALAWFDAERAALVALAGTAARAGWHPQVWHLAWALVDFFDRRAHWHDWAATQTLAVHAAGELDHPAGRAVAHRGVATAYVRLRRYDDAETHFRLALDLFRTAGDAAGEVDVHFDLCAVSEGRGQIRQALGHAREAVDRYRAAGNRRGAAQALNALGWYHGQVAEFDHMLAHCREALALLQSLGDRHGQAESWGNIGYAQHHLGRHGGAAAAYRPALDLFDEVGDRYGRAWVLTHLGDAQLAGGDPAAARAAWSAALAILDELGHAEADDVRVRLSALPDAGVTAAAVTS